MAKVELTAVRGKSGGCDRDGRRAQSAQPKTHPRRPPVPHPGRPVRDQLAVDGDVVQHREPDPVGVARRRRVGALVKDDLNAADLGDAEGEPEGKASDAANRTRSHWERSWGAPTRVVASAQPKKN